MSFGQMLTGIIVFVLYKMLALCGAENSADYTFRFLSMATFYIIVMVSPNIFEKENKK